MNALVRALGTRLARSAAVASSVRGRRLPRRGASEHKAATVHTSMLVSVLQRRHPPRVPALALHFLAGALVAALERRLLGRPSRRYTGLPLRLRLRGL